MKTRKLIKKAIADGYDPAPWDGEQPSGKIFMCVMLAAYTCNKEVSDRAIKDIEDAMVDYTDLRVSRKWPPTSLTMAVRALHGRSLTAVEVVAHKKAFWHKYFGIPSDTVYPGDTSNDK